MTLSVRDQVRLLLGDNVVASPLFQDDELDFFLSQRNSDIYLATADAAEAAAFKFARAYDISTGAEQLRRSQVMAAFRELAKDLRARRNSIQTLVLTKIDGYSIDIPADEVQTVSTSPRRHYYGEPDRVPRAYDRDADLFAGLLLHHELES